MALIDTGRGLVELTQSGARDLSLRIDEPRKGFVWATEDVASIMQFVEVAAAWHAGISLTELVDRFPFMKPRPFACVREEGGSVTEAQWQYILTEPIEAPMHRLLNEAYTRQQLRQLFPYTSHYQLHFSRCTGYPYTRTLPYIAHLGDKGYTVVERAIGFEPEVVEPGPDAERTVIDLLVAHLPHDLGPAVDGTADDPRLKRPE